MSTRPPALRVWIHPPHYDTIERYSSPPERDQIPRDLGDLCLKLAVSMSGRGADVQPTPRVALKPDTTFTGTGDDLRNAAQSLIDSANTAADQANQPDGFYHGDDPRARTLTRTECLHIAAALNELASIKGTGGQSSLFEVAS